MPVEPDDQQQPLDIHMLARAFEARLERAGAVRSMAKNWADGIKGLLGIVVAVSFLAVPASANDLSHGSRIAIGGLLALTLALGSIALLLMMSAAFGTPKATPEPTSAKGLSTMKRDEYETDRRRLGLGRLAITGSIAALSAAVIATWALQREPDTDDLKVRDDQGAVYCGSFVSGGHRQLRLAIDGQLVRIPLRTVESVTSGGC